MSVRQLEKCKAVCCVLDGSVVTAFPPLESNKQTLLLCLPQRKALSDPEVVGASHTFTPCGAQSPQIPEPGQSRFTVSGP